MQLDGVRQREGRRRLERGRPAALPGRRDARARRRHGGREGAAQRQRRSASSATRRRAGRSPRALRGFGYRAGVAAPVNVGGRVWGVLAAATTSEDPLPAGLEQRLCDFADLVAQALANADAYEKLAASRARVVEVGDAERQRLERNLHDGAQQRLVSVALELSMVAASWSATRAPPGSCSPRPRRISARGSPSCASWLGGSIRSSSPSAASVPRSTPCSRARRCPSRSRCCPRSG